MGEIDDRRWLVRLITQSLPCHATTTAKANATADVLQEKDLPARRRERCGKRLIVAGFT